MKNYNFDKNINIKFNIFVYLIFLITLFFIFPKDAYSLASYTDPIGYPRAWSNFTVNQYYTSQNSILNDLPGGSGGDASDGGTNPSGAVDFSNLSGNSYAFDGDGSIMYFNFRLGTNPLALTGSGQPFTSATWNILLDTDGDGFKEFIVMLEGIDGGSQPDDIVVIYDNSQLQTFDTASDGIWRQDCAKHPTSSTNSNGEPGNSSNWDIDTDPYVWNFSRVRISQVDRTKTAGSSQSEYILEIQVPIQAFDATSISGPALTSTSLFTMAATSSNSNQNPTQKDLLYSGDYTMCPTCPLPTGDLVDPQGNIYQEPIVTSITSTSCPSPVTLTADVVDALIISGGAVIDTISSVNFYYYRDINNNGLADDGNSWVLIGSGARGTTLGLFTTSWNTSSLLSGNYLIKVIASDTSGYTTDSTNQTKEPTYVVGTFNNSCGIVIAVDLSITTASQSICTGNTVVYQPFNVRNSSPSASDRINLVANSPNSFKVELLNSTGTVIIATDNEGDGVWDTINSTYDTDSNGQPDTGLITAGSSVNYQIRITVLNSLMGGSIEGTVITGRSVTDVTKIDTQTLSTTGNKCDYGDAPNTYSTLQASNGARHIINTTTLYIDDNIPDHDSNGFVDGVDNSLNASDDDNDTSDDEDAITTFPPLSTFITSYSLSLKATNTSGSSATLVGWIDFDRDGIFQTDEGVSVSVPNGTNGSNFTLTWNNIGSTPNIVAGASYVRFRLATGITTSNPTGSFNNGEVEDYPINILSTRFSISGRVFEDINYGGGSGRSLVASSGLVCSGVRVELYNASTGAYIANTTTNASGVYTFSNQIPNNYIVRVPSLNIRSSRTGGGGSEIGVQTFRTDASSGVVLDVTDHVGGEVPNKIDAGNSTSNLSTLTTSTRAPQSITTVNLVSNLSGIDFGYNFDAIVNTNDTGQGSLRQFILNSNSLGNSGLSQVGQTAGKEVSIFMIPNSIANDGQNTSYTDQLTTYGSARIIIASTLTITASDTIIDGRTQTNNVKTFGGSETNSLLLGSGGSVGVFGTSLSRFNAPEIEIQGNNIVGITNNTGLSGIEIRSIALENCSIYIKGSSNLVQDNLVGMRADGTQGTAFANTYGIRIDDNSSNMTIRHNYVRVNNSGIRRDVGGFNMLVEYNEVDKPFTPQSNTYEAFLLIGAGNNDTIRYNLFKNMRGAGSEIGYTGGVLTNVFISENTYTQNGYDSTAISSNEPIGIVIRALGNGSSLTFSKNVVSYNAGPGILVMSSLGVKISQNSTFGNGNGLGGSFGLAIDLDSVDRDPNTLAYQDRVTGNDGILNNTQANRGMDYPIFTYSILNAGILTLKGYVGSASGQSTFSGLTVEVFKADDDSNNYGVINAGDGQSVPHGEGKTYIGSCTTDASGNIDCSLNTTSLAVGDYITATAIDVNGNTSEFSPNFIISYQALIFSPNNSKTASTGSIIYYPHLLKTFITGNITLSSTSDKGWTYILFNDVNANSVLDAPDVQLTSNSLGNVYNNPNHLMNILVKLQIPEGTPNGTVDNFIITATHEDTRITPVFVMDTTTVSSNALSLIKSVSPTGSQLPGTNLTYTIIYTNVGTTVIFNIKIYDVVPEYTSFISVSSGGVYDPATKNIIWDIPTLIPGATGSVSFVVKIN